MQDSRGAFVEREVRRGHPSPHRAGGPPHSDTFPLSRTKPSTESGFRAARSLLLRPFNIPVNKRANRRILLCAELRLQSLFQFDRSRQRLAHTWLWILSFSNPWQPSVRRSEPASRHFILGVSFFGSLLRRIFDLELVW